MATKSSFPTVGKYAVDDKGKRLPDDKIKVIEQAAAKLKKRVAGHRAAAFVIGAYLVRVRNTGIGTDAFCRFVKEVAGISLSTAYNYMNVFKAYKKPDALPDLPFGRELYDAAAQVIAKQKGKAAKAPRGFSAKLWASTQTRFLHRLDTDTKAALATDPKDRQALVSELEKAHGRIGKAITKLQAADKLAKAA